MKHDGQDFLSFWTFFLPFYPPNNPKNQNFNNNKKKKKKKTPGDIIILHMCTKNYDQMMYSSHFGLENIVTGIHFYNKKDNQKLKHGGK